MEHTAGTVLLYLRKHKECIVTWENMRNALQCLALYFGESGVCCYCRASPYVQAQYHDCIVWHARGFTNVLLNAVCTCYILCMACLLSPWPTKRCPMSSIQFLSLKVCLCRFAHPAGPAPTPPPSVQPVCRYWRFGTCRYGSACRFRSARPAACGHSCCDSGSSLHCSL